MGDLLVAEHLTKRFGHLHAVDDLSFEVREGEILGVMGPNGAGKTTVFNLLTGAYSPDEGTIVFKGDDITRYSPAKRCRRGIGRTYQIPRPFGKMTVMENLLVGGIHGGKQSERQAREKVYEILEMIGLYGKKDVFAGGPIHRTPPGPAR